MEAFALIEDFFSAIPLARHRKLILSLLKAANSPKCWDKEDPGGLLYFQKKLLDLIRAARQLSLPGRQIPASRSKRALGTDILNSEPIEPALYMDPGLNQTQWEAFPRYLSKKEFMDPYLAFGHFFRVWSPNTWRKNIEELVFYALSPHDSAGDLVDFDFLWINRRLQKLVEAAHLILIREINPGRADP